MQRLNIFGIWVEGEGDRENGEEALLRGWLRTVQKQWNINQYSSYLSGDFLLRRFYQPRTSGAVWTFLVIWAIWRGGGGASGQRPEMPLCPPMYRTFPTTKNHPVKMSTELRWRNTKSPHWLFPWPGMLFLQLFTRQLLFMNSLNSSRLREALPEHPISSRPSPLLAHGSTAPEHSSPSPCLG